MTDHSPVRSLKEHCDACHAFAPGETLHLEPVSGLLSCDGCRPSFLAARPANRTQSLEGQHLKPTSRRPAGSR